MKKVGSEKPTNASVLAIWSKIEYGRAGEASNDNSNQQTAGARLVPKIILVEPDRLLVGTESFGVFEFAKPARLSASAGGN